MGKLIDLTGQRFGRLVVLEKDLSKKSRVAYWMCQCDCGNIKSIRGSSLRQEDGTRSCGCLGKEKSSEAHLIDLKGQRFGRLLVIKRDKDKNEKNKSAYWICQCDCGNAKSIDGSSLRKGTTISCGCYMEEQRGKSLLEDLVGQRFGRLIVVKQVPTLKTGKYSYPRWECKCDCGETVITTSGSLRNGNIESCGCLRRERHRNTVTKDLSGMTFGKLTVVELDEGTSKERGRLYWKCICECGNIKVALGESLKRGFVNSCGCLISKGEEKLRKILEENYYNFISQYSFKDLKGKVFPLRFDFAILDENDKLICLIEYQGNQHYQKQNYFGGEESFQKQEEYDQKKQKYCEDNDIKLVKIPYWDYNKINAEYLQEKIFE